MDENHDYLVWDLPELPPLPSGVNGLLNINHESKFVRMSVRVVYPTSDTCLQILDFLLPLGERTILLLSLESDRCAPLRIF